jgi:hypothetical protein
VVGEPYWRTLPLPDDYVDRDDPWTTLDGTIRSRHEQHKRTYLRRGRDYLGWAIFVGWKRPA